MEVKEVVRKLADLNIMKRERPSKSAVEDEQFCVRVRKFQRRVPRVVSN